MTADELELEVWRLFDMLDNAIREPIRKRWRQVMLADERPLVVTDPEELNAAEESLGYVVDKAATNGVTMYFRLDRMAQSGVDPRLIILHEWAHCYFFAVGKFSLSRYREDEKHRRKCEKATQKLSEMWFKRIKHQDALRTKRLLEN